ncbi:MAG: ion transporter [Sandaracinus sp.]|nr:ion transporter [Sandaracinus sp.]
MSSASKTTTAHAPSALHRAFHDPSARSYRVVEGVVWALVLLSLVLLAIEPMLEGATLRAVLIADQVLLAGIGVELALRVATYSPPSLQVFARPPAHALRTHVLARLGYLLHPLNLVDLLTILALHPGLRGLRLLRLLRLLRSERLFRYGNPFKSLFHAFDQDRALWLAAFSILGVETLLGGGSLYLVEHGHPDGITSFGEGLWWSLVTITTVGYGDVTPVTDLGRVIAGTLMVAGLFTLALFAGIVGHSLLNAVLTIREDQFRMSGRANHVVVCGFEEGLEQLLHAFVEERSLVNAEVVLFGPHERPAGIPPELAWVQGDPTKESELEKVRLVHASAVLVVGSRKVTPQQADATTLLTLFTMRSFLAKSPLAAARRRPVHVVAEILDTENADHARTAGADEVIESQRVGFAMLVHSLAFPGVGDATARIVSAGASDLYLGAVPDGVARQTFGELAAALRSAHGVLVVGWQDDSGRVHVNPKDDASVGACHAVVYLAERPVLGVPS